MTTAAAVSYYRQSTPFTCGPAAMAIALAYFGLGEADLATERLVYRNCRETHAAQPKPHRNGHVSHAEMARFWLGRGGRARQRHRDPGTLHSGLIDDKIRRYLAVEQEAVARGLELILEEPTEAQIAADLAEGWIAIPRVRFGDSPHNQVVYAIRDGRFHAACPVLGPVTHAFGELEAAMEFPTGRSVLLIRT